MTLEAGKEMDRRCVMVWLYEVYVTPSRAFYEYTDDELKMFAHDALVLLKEQPQIVRGADCKYGEPGKCGDGIDCDGIWHDDDWFCADGEKNET